MRHEDDRQRAPAGQAEDPAAPAVPSGPALRDPELPLLTETERSCLARYLDLLADALGDELEEVVVVFGSVARGESWPRGMPIRSDLDLLVVTDRPLAAERQEELIGATLPLFLECGRQIGPQFRTRAGLSEPASAPFLAEVERDGITLYRRPDGAA